MMPWTLTEDQVDPVTRTEVMDLLGTALLAKCQPAKHLKRRIRSHCKLIMVKNYKTWDKNYYFALLTKILAL